MQTGDSSVSSQGRSLAELDARRVTAHCAAINDPGGFLRFSVSLVNAAGATLFRSAAKGIKVEEELLSRQALSWSTTLRQELAASAKMALSEGRTDCRHLESATGVWIISSPLIADNHPWCLSLLIFVGDRPPEPFLVIAQLLAALLAPRRLNLTGEHSGKGGLEELLELLGQLLGQTDQKETLVRLNSSLKRWAGCSRVAIGTSAADGQMTLCSLSDVTTIDQRTDHSRIIAKVMRECADRRAPLLWPQQEDGPATSPILQEAAAASKAAQCLALPVASVDVAASGVFVLFWEEGGDRSGVTAALKRTSPLLTAILTGLFRPHSTLDALIGSGTKNFFGLRRSTLALFAAIVIILTGLLPVPFRISADCVTQPVTIRAIVSRFDGVLKEVAVQPGDQVEAGATLARLDGKETDLQLASVIAERDKGIKLRDQYLAAGDTALAQIARLDSQRLEEQINLIREKQEHLVLTSPIIGIVLSGDLKRAEGSPVTKGQVLFEVAPLDSMDVELAVPERDIAFVRTGMAVMVRFTAYPDTGWQGVVEHIVPKSQIRGTNNVFLARLRFSNTNGLLRPGMRGESTISAGWRPLAWQLFRTPWHTLRLLADRIF